MCVDSSGAAAYAFGGVGADIVEVFNHTVEVILISGDVINKRRSEVNDMNHLNLLVAQNCIE